MAEMALRETAFPRLASVRCRYGCIALPTRKYPGQPPAHENAQPVAMLSPSLPSAPLLQVAQSCVPGLYSSLMLRDNCRYVLALVTLQPDLSTIFSYANKRRISP